jgi:hypothetical protein
MKTKQVKIAVDRGNGSSKIVCSVDGSPIKQFKIASVIRKIETTDTTIQIGETSALVGKTALVAKTGTAETPLLKQDKIADLSYVIAQALHEVLGEGCNLTLDVGVASPLNNEGTRLAIKQEVDILLNGFSIGGQTYTVEKIERVICESEGAVILKTNPEFNVSIDVGFGTLLVFYKDLDGKIKNASYIDGETGGVNLTLKELRESTTFIEAMRKAGLNSIPSAEIIAAMLAKEDGYMFRGVNLIPLIKPCINSLVERINAACEAAKVSFLGQYSYDPDLKLKPVLIGGGAALLKAVIANKGKVSLSKDITIFEPTPDYQTSLIIHQILNTTPITENGKEVTTGNQSQNKQVCGVIA